jgi:dTDP-4-dehydrorhamnose reductase
MKILILGAGGQVGKALTYALQKVGKTIPMVRAQLDITKFVQLRDVINQYKPAVVVNAAAYTNVDQAESQHKIAKLINTEAVQTLGEICAKTNSLLVHYSTDYVFDGKKQAPYTEEDSPSPCNVYGQTKLEGEQTLQKISNLHYLIFRTSWIFGLGGRNFPQTILQKAATLPKLTIVNDQKGSPTSAQLVAQTTAKILKMYAEKNLCKQVLNEVYHLTAQGYTTWYYFARHLLTKAEENGWDLCCRAESISPVLTKDYPTTAARPLNSRLNTSKIQRAFSIKLPFWQQDADAFIHTLQKPLNTTPTIRQESSKAI